MKVGLIVPMGDELQPGVPQRWSEIKSLAIAAEEAGLDTVWVYDHLLSDGPDKADESPWEAWTLLTAIAAVTTRVKLGPLVLCAPFRDPGVLARMADTFQEISDNRLVLGLGCGWHLLQRRPARRRPLITSPRRAEGVEPVASGSGPSPTAAPRG